MRRRLREPGQNQHVAVSQRILVHRPRMRGQRRRRRQVDDFLMRRRQHPIATAETKAGRRRHHRQSAEDVLFLGISDEFDFGQRGLHLVTRIQLRPTGGTRPDGVSHGGRKEFQVMRILPLRRRQFGRASLHPFQHLFHEETTDGERRFRHENLAFEFGSFGDEGESEHVMIIGDENSVDLA